MLVDDSIRGLNMVLDLVAKGVKLCIDSKDLQVVEMKGFVEDPCMTRYPRAPQLFVWKGNCPDLMAAEYDNPWG